MMEDPLIPNMVGFVMIPPSLYQLTEKCGVDGGISEKCPQMLTCGNFRCGRLQEKLKKERILSMAAFTISLAFCTGFTIAVLIAFQVDVALLLIPSNTLEVVDLIAFQTLLIVVFTAFTIVVIVVLILFHTLLAVLRILFSVEVMNSLIAFHTFVMTVWIALITEVTVSLTAF